MKHFFDIQKMNGWFHDVCEKTGLVFWIRDVNYQNQYYLSPNYQTIWGRSVAELYEHPYSWKYTVLEGDRPYTRGVEHPADTTYYRISHGNGSIIHICDKAFQLVDKTGTPFANAGVAQSIFPEEWFAERERQDSSEKNEHILFLQELIKQSMGLLLPQLTAAGQEHYKIQHRGNVYILSLREAQCLCYLSMGYTSKETAREMKISPRTVETYLEKIRQKTNSRNKLQVLGEINMEDLNLLRKQLL